MPLELARDGAQSRVQLILWRALLGAQHYAEEGHVGARRSVQKRTPTARERGGHWLHLHGLDGVRVRCRLGLSPAAGERGWRIAGDVALVYATGC